MQRAERYSLFETPLGVMALVWRGEAVLCLRLPDTDEAALIRRIETRFPSARSCVLVGAAKDAADGVAALASGAKRDLRYVRVELPEMDEVSRGALSAARDIPPGETRTYGDIARQLGDVAWARRVGQAMARNPLPIIIPCHRVIGEGGKLTGFSAPGGIDAKLKLLEIEGALRSSLFDDLPLARKKD